MKNKKINIEEVPEIEKMRHTASHILAQAVLKLYPDAKLGIGPAIDNGFYYDFEFSKPLELTDLERIEKEIKKIIKEDLPLKQILVDRKKAQELLKGADQKYKLEILKDIEDKKISFYITGKDEFADLCRGPHVESTGDVGAIKLSSVAGAYWKGDEKQPMLTRIYGFAFSKEEELQKHLENIAEAEKRDHRKLGPQLGIFFMDETAPGMPYWLPKGTIILNELLSFWRKEHKKLGYQETVTPLLNKKELYVTSGHWDHYKDFMFISEVDENQTYCLKPMNCPNAMMLFKRATHSYRDLPLRYSDCDALHRHEKGGELNGLLRVQKFQQDDAHIFVTEDQIKEEYERILDIAKKFYGIFDIDFKLRLGTRPDDFMGDPKTWDKAEKELKEILEASKFDYYVGEGEGAFYGPKVDILMKDCMGREWQTGTIQLDFQLPKKFDLKYTDTDGKEKMPIVIHRVIYGSLERFIAILIEQYAGAFPLWIAPTQVVVIPIADRHTDYAREVVQRLDEEEIRYELDNRTETLQSKIRDHELNKVPYVLIVGDKEIETKTVSVRSRATKEQGLLKLEEFLEKITLEIKNKGKK